MDRGTVGFRASTAADTVISLWHLGKGARRCWTKSFSHGGSQEWRETCIKIIKKCVMLSNLLPAKICRTVPFKVAMQVIQDSLEVANCSKCRPVTKSCWVSHCCCCPWYRSLTEVAYFLEVHVKGKWNASDIANSEWQRPHTSLGWVEWCSCSLELYHSNRSANCYRCFRHPQHSSSSIFYLFCKTTRLWKGYAPAHCLLF